MKVHTLFLLFFISAATYGQPVIHSFTPMSGSIGTTVTITGNNFSSTISNNIVYFGAVKANITAASATALTVIVPAGATYQSISVTVNGLTGFSDKPFIVTFVGNPGYFTNGSFQKVLDSTTGITPSGIGIGDLDNDSKPDVVVANLQSNSISVYRNTSIDSGNISFGGQQNFLAGSFPTNVAIGDLDGDGKLDLAISNEHSSSISIYRNVSSTANISFSNKIDLLIGAGRPIAVKIADFNKDGKPDLAVSVVYGKVVVFKNIGSVGNLAFEPPIHFTVTTTPFSIALSDFDKDGKEDIAVGDSAVKKVAVLKNTSFGANISFAPMQEFNSEYSFAISSTDINGDNLSDLLSTGYEKLGTNKNITSAGSMSFDPVISTNVGFGRLNDLHCSDLNGDGKPDVAIAKYGFDVITNNSSNNMIAYSTKKSYGNSSAYRLAIGDLNKDGKPEIVCTGDGNIFSVFKNRVGESVQIALCPNGGTSINTNITSSTYQWQLNFGSGFFNISNDGTYFSGTTTANLQLTNIPSTWYGCQFRCVVNDGYSDTYITKFSNNWIGTSNTNWGTASNWSCGTVPDANTDVIISGGNIVINSNVTVRTLTIHPGANIVVSSGYTLTITH